MQSCRVTLQWNKSDCILLHLVGLLFNVNYDARNHELKIRTEGISTKQFALFDALSRKTYIYNIYIYIYIGFGGLGIACWPLVPKFAGSNRPKAVEFLGRKNLQHAFLRREVKPSVPCRRFAACKRSLNLSGSRNLGKITGQISRSKFHLSLLGSLASLRTYRHLAAKVGTSKDVGESNGKLPPRTCPGCSVPEPYRSHDWTLVPASPASKA